jgi:hypothetical protein
MSNLKIKNTANDSVQMLLDTSVIMECSTNEFVAKTVASISKLDTATTTGAVNVLNYHSGLEGGGGVFYWDATGNATEHNGGTVISPVAFFPTDWSNQTQRATWFDGSKLSGTGVWRRQYDGVVNVKLFGAKGDGVTDDTLAIQNAINAAGVSGAVFFEAGSYAQTATLSTLTGQKWVGEGGKRSVKLLKNFNGDQVVVNDLSAIEYIDLEANGAMYSGRGFYVAPGYSQIIKHCRVATSQGPCLEFAKDAGGGANIIDFEGTTYDPTNVAAIKIGEQSGPKPKFFDGIWLSGGLFDLASKYAGNGCSLTNFYIRNFLLTGPIGSGSGLFHITNGRVASINDTTVVSGSDMSFSNVAFSGPVVLTNAQGIHFDQSCLFGAGITEDSTCNSNLFTQNTTAYTPNWYQPSGTQPSIADGSITSFYRRDGNIVTVIIRVVMGANTVYGNSSTGWYFSLPYTATPNYNQRALHCLLYSASGAKDYNANISIGGGESAFSIGYSGQSLRSGYPVTYGSGDVIDIKLSYSAK